jgi:very-short-patch-repair endonuclease
MCAPHSKLIIEVDGSQHLDQEEYDAERTAFLQAKGFHVLRFWNSDVMNKINDVMGVILEAISTTVMKTEEEIKIVEEYK